MLNQDIRRTSFYILQQNPLPVVLLAGINTGFYFMAGKLIENFANRRNMPLSLFIVFLFVVIKFVSQYAYMRSWLFAKPSFSYFVEPFTQKNHRNKMLQLMLIVFVIFGAIAMSILYFRITFAFGLMASLTVNGPEASSIVSWLYIYVAIILLVAIAVTMAIHIWVVKPEYNVFGILKRAVIYSLRNCISWLWFTLTLRFIPSIILLILKGMFEGYACYIVYIPVVAYTCIAQAGFVYENILKMEFGKESAISYAKETVMQQWNIQ